MGALQGLGRALRYARHYRNWREVARIRNGGGVCHSATLRNGLRFDAPDDTNVLRVISGVFFRRYYNPPELGDIGPQDVVIDVGANVGTFSVYAARRTRAPVLAIEPFPTNVEYLQRNLRANGCEDVRVLPYALAAQDGRGSLGVHASGVGHSLTHAATTQDAELDIATRSFESIVAEHELERVDFLKLDCEGAEGTLLTSTSAECMGRVQRIAMEFHDNASPLDHDALEARLVELGFRTRLDWDGSDVRGFLYAWR